MLATYDGEDKYSRDDDLWQALRDGQKDALSELFGKYYQRLFNYGMRTEAQQVVSTNEVDPNLRIVPVGRKDWSPELIQGQTEPVIQGWYSATYGKKVPNPTAVYKTKIEGDATFAWVLIPAKGKVPSVKVKLIEANNQQMEIKIKREGDAHTKVTIPLDETGIPSIK